jgi:hypothetical protein
LLGYGSQTAWHRTLLQYASAPTVQAALTAVCWDRKIGIQLGCGCADRDSGRGTGQRSFIRKMRHFEESYTFASHNDAVVEHPYVAQYNTPPLGWGFFTGVAVPYPGVDTQIDGQHENTEGHLHFLCKRRGINNGNNVMFNKTAFIAGRATCLAKPVLDWSQRTKPTSKLDQGCPQDSRDMDTGPPFPPEYQEAAKH